MAKYIAIDAGHGGYDAGASNGKRQEKDDNLRLAHEIRRQLLEQGQRVLLIRSDDTFVSLADRVETANREKADLFVSVHRNSYTSSVANGAEVWVYTNAPESTEQYAQNVLDEIVNVGVQQNRGLQRGNYYVLRLTEMPAMMVLTGFISNKIDNILFDQYFSQYAAAIVKGILKSLGEPHRQLKPHIMPLSAGPTYRVMMGTFTNRTYAEDLAKELNSKGYSAVVVKD